MRTELKAIQAARRKLTKHIASCVTPHTYKSGYDGLMIAKIRSLRIPSCEGNQIKYMGADWVSDEQFAGAMLTIDINSLMLDDLAILALHVSDPDNFKS